MRDPPGKIPKRLPGQEKHTCRVPHLEREKIRPGAGENVRFFGKNTKTRQKGHNSGKNKGYFML